MGQCVCSNSGNNKIADEQNLTKSKDDTNVAVKPHDVNNAIELAESKNDGDVTIKPRDINNIMILVVKVGGIADSSQIVWFEEENKSDPSSRDFEQVIKELEGLSDEQKYKACYKAVEKLYGKEIRRQALARKMKELSKTIINTLKSEDEPTITEYVIGELEAAIKNKSVHLKAIGADRAFTAISKPNGSNGISIDITQRNYKNPDCQDLLNDENGTFSKTLLSDNAQKLLSTNNIALIESGCYVGTIEDYWWKPDKDDSTSPRKSYHSKHRSSLYDSNGNIYKCLPNRGGYEMLSLCGLSSVGAMGYSGTNYNNQGANLGGIQSAILSLRLLTVEDNKIKQYQIEPSVKNGGIFNPDSKDQLSKLGIELIQDDQIFSDVVVSMGTYGVITHCYITLVDAFWLVMHRDFVRFTPSDQQPWIDKYNEINANPDVYQFETWYQPYVGDFQKCTMAISYFIKAPNDSKPNTREEIIKCGGANLDIEKFPLETVLIASASVQILSILKHATKLKGQGTIAVALNISLDETKISPNIDPNTGKKVDTLIMSSVEALDFGTTNLVPTNTSGNSFRIEKSIDAVSDYIKFLNEQGDKTYLTITSPLALRFSKKSFGSVSCAGEYDVGWIEQPILTVTPYEKDAFNNSVSLLKITRDWFNTNYESKIHWGLWFDENNKNGSNLWWNNISNENKTSFFTNYKKFNKDGVFKNTFTQNSGMDDFSP